MKLSEFSIQRPVFASVMSFAILLFGIISFLRLPVREYPDIDPPIVSITTFYRGASPSVIETEITDVLEEQLATLEDVKLITSSSLEQGSDRALLVGERALERGDAAAAPDHGPAVAFFERLCHERAVFDLVGRVEHEWIDLHARYVGAAVGAHEAEVTVALRRRLVERAFSRKFTPFLHAVRAA